MKISILGTTTVAQYFAKALDATGFEITEVYGRKAEAARKVTSLTYEGEVRTHTDLLDSPARIFILAVEKNETEALFEELKLPRGSILVGTDPNFSILQIKNAWPQYENQQVAIGILCPLLPLDKLYSVDLSKVPMGVDAENPEHEEKLANIGKRLSEIVYVLNTTERSLIGLALVFSCQFTNHLLALSNEILLKNGMEFDLIKPAIKAAINLALKADHPADLQYGPAVNGDKKLIRKHLEMLDSETDMQQVYESITASIHDWHT